MTAYHSFPSDRQRLFRACNDSWQSLFHTSFQLKHCRMMTSPSFKLNWDSASLDTKNIGPAEQVES
jgi:hypothetical protein